MTNGTAIHALPQMTIAARATETAVAHMQTIDTRIGAVLDIAARPTSSP